MSRFRPGPAGLLLLSLWLLAPAGAAACPPLLAPDELPPEPNGIELGLGTTNVNAAIGSGRLTATLSRCGEITSLKWPGPSYYDQLDYLASNAADARTLPHFGALDSMGAFAGLWVETHGGARLTWLRDAEWQGSQRYTASTSDVVENTFVHPGLGLRVRVDSFVLPERDVLVQRFRVRRLPGSPARRVRLLWYGNFAPTQERVPEIPIADMGLDHLNDFVALYDDEASAVLHYASGPRRSFGAVNTILRDPPADPAALRAAVQALSRSLAAPGVYLAYGFRGGDDGFQVGFDDAPTCAHQSAIVDRAAANLGFPPAFVAVARALFSCERSLGQEPLAACRAENGWTWNAESAFRDAEDGVLAGSPIAACRANAALARELVFRGGRAEATLYLAAAGTRAGALAALADARAEPGPEAQRARTERWWADWIAPAILPDTDDPEVLRFARRALLSLRTATDEASGAMVASVAAQPPYGLDWPRDGAFFDHALDLAGYHDLVTRHNAFYVRVQRKDFEPWSFLYGRSCPMDPAARAYPDCVPPGTFAMNYYADPDAVVAGGPISFEIDEAGLAAWALWEHARFLEGEARGAYLAEVCPAIARTAASLAACRDPATGLQCPSNEDDNLPLTQGLQGAETVHLALRSAVEAGADCGFDPDAVAGWQARADELRAAILEHFVVHDALPHFEGPRRPWALWPARLVGPDDPLALSHAEYLRRHSLEPVLERSAGRAGYDAESIIARAELFRARGDAAAVAAMRDDVRFLIRELTTPDTGHMAEFAGLVDRDLDGDGVAPDYLPENDVPHVWQQLYVYTAAMLTFGSAGAPAPRACDVDGDGGVDRRDVLAVLRARGARAPDLLDPRDPDEDGVVTLLDARACRLRCDRAHCATHARPGRPRSGRHGHPGPGMTRSPAKASR